MPQIRMNPPEPLSERTPPTFDTHIPAVEAWIADLPLANVDKTCGLVSNALTEINGLELTHSQRFKLLELFRRPLDYLDDALRSHFINAALPLLPRTKTTAALLYDVHMEMAKAYQRIVDTLLVMDNHRQDFALLAITLQRTLSYYEQALLTVYQVYKPVTSGLWQTIHGLYDAAERKGLQSTPVKDAFHRHGWETTIAAQYKQILLLALTNPYRLSQADITQVHKVLQQWAFQSRLYPADHFDEPPNVCIVDLDSDMPPAYLVHSNIPHYTSCRMLDNADLLQTLRNQIPRSRLEPATSRVPLGTSAWKDLLQYLLAAWGSASKRKFQRNDGTHAPMQWVAGLGGCYRLLGGENIQSEASASAFGHRLSNAAMTDSAFSPPPINVGKILNESASGTCLQWQSTEAGKLRVGEVIALRHQHPQESRWGIGAIRWLKTQGDGGLLFGIELLDPEALPVAARHYKEEPTEQEYLQSLFLPEVKPLRQEASLLVSASLFQTNDEITIIMDQQEQRLRLGKALESNAIYSRFQFTPAS